jgi:chromate transport protein ChrA
LRIVDVVVAVKVDDELGIREECGGPQLCVQGTCLLVVVIIWVLLTRDINKHWEALFSGANAEIAFMMLSTAWMLQHNLLKKEQNHQ